MDLSQETGPIIGLVVCFVAAMFLAAAEAALLRISPFRAKSLAARKTTRGRRLAALIADLPNVLNTVLLAALLAQIGAATIAGGIAERQTGSFGVTVASIGLTLLLFVYGEAIPKTFAVRHADRVGLALSAPLSVLEWILRPIVRLLVWVADLQMPGKGIIVPPSITEEELRHMSVSAAREGEITDSDLELIHGAFRLGDRRVHDVMVPRPDVVAVAATDSVAEALDLALAAGHRRLPVYENTVDDITGLVHTRDLMRVPGDRRPVLQVGVLAREPLVVPESKRVLDLLEEMQAHRTHLAVIVDEFGSTAGLVTVEDIAEELLGAISEGAAPDPVVETAPGTWSVDARLPIGDLEVLTGSSLDALFDDEVPPGASTVAGLIMWLAGRIPDLGDRVEFGDHWLRVAAVRRRRITRVEVARR
ncbi:MAG: hemolysin family protein [Acidimicrobiia bacterium]|nr:hemolysin family protein [Acidimicrobiia bacterium]